MLRFHSLRFQHVGFKKRATYLDKNASNTTYLYFLLYSV